MAQPLECPIRLGGGEYNVFGAAKHVDDSRAILTDEALILRANVAQELGWHLEGASKVTKYFQNDKVLTIPLSAVESIMVQPGGGEWRLQTGRCTWEVTKLEKREGGGLAPGERETITSAEPSTVLFYPRGERGALFRRQLASALSPAARKQSIKLMTRRSIMWSVLLLLALPIGLVPGSGLIVGGLAFWTFRRLDEGLRCFTGGRVRAVTFGLVLSGLQVLMGVASIGVLVAMGMPA